jgi:uncharacterized SAM-binding protein YcdF (DUF218 family)
MISPLERRLRRSESTDWRNVEGLIVLTGGVWRLLEAADLARRYSHLKVVVSGTKEMPQLLAHVNDGCDSCRVTLEARAHNTYENALYSAKLMRSRATGLWLVVTSAYHMPRAIGCFRKTGFRVEPWPVYDLAHYADGFLKLAAREWTALIGYRILGRTRTLFPGPAN